MSHQLLTSYETNRNQLPGKSDIARAYSCFKFDVLLCKKLAARRTNGAAF
jgi:hypothetical protein